MFGKLFLLIPYLFVFLASFYRPYDSDLGWHLKYGEYFFKTGKILNDNTFSSMMPNFKWANTSWGNDVINYAAFNAFGFLGLTLLGALIITLTFFFFSKAFKLTFFEQSLIFPVILWLEHPINQVSFRGSIMSLFFLSILFFLLMEYERTKSKKLYLVIPLFLLWSNLHGLFILGLALFTIWTILYVFQNMYELYIEKKKIEVKDAKKVAIVFVLSIFATFIHPYGVEIYVTAFRHFLNPDLQSVMEYLPIEELSQLWWKHLVIGVLVMFGLIFMYFNDVIKKSMPFIGIVSLLYVLSWFVRRYAWSFYYLTIPFLKPLAGFFTPNSKKAIVISATTLFIVYIGFIAVMKSPLEQYKDMSWDVYCEKYQGCSKKAAQFIIDNKLNNKPVLNLYGWGGWLIWNYPKIKPVIDGRMHLWKDERGYSAFNEYYQYEQDYKDVDKWKYNVVFMTPQKPMYDRLIELVGERKWKLAYEDKYAGVFVRNK